MKIIIQGLRIHHFHHCYNLLKYCNQSYHTRDALWRIFFLQEKSMRLKAWQKKTCLKKKKFFPKKLFRNAKKNPPCVLKKKTNVYGNSDCNDHRYFRILDAGLDYFICFECIFINLNYTILKILFFLIT